MGEDILSSVFRNYMSNKAKVSEIATSIDAVIRAVLSSPHGESLENIDGFSDTPADRQISTIRAKQPDEYRATSDIVIEVFAEGRVSVTGAWYEDGNVQHREERTFYYSTQDNAPTIAARALSAMVDLNENSVADAFKDFTMSTTQDAHSHPTAET